MKTETVIPYHWLRRYPKEVIELDSSPILGDMPSFPWGNFSELLGKSLSLPDLKISPKDVEWIAADKVTEGLGSDPFILNFKVIPLVGTAHVLFPKEALKALFRLTVGTEEALFPEQQVEWEKEFYHFLASEAIQSFQKVPFDASLIPQMQDEEGLTEEFYLTNNIECTVQDRTFTARLALSKEFKESLAKKYIPKGMKYPAGTMEASLVTLQLVGGRVELTRNEWKAIQPGDFLLLNSCTLSTDEEKGRVQILLNGKPLFRAKTKQNQLKILEYPLLSEVTTPMAKSPEIDDEDEDFESEIEETEEEYTEEEYTEEHDTEEEETEEEHEEETIAEAPVKKDQEKAEALSKSSQAKPTVSSAPLPKIKPDEIPLTVTVETGRIQMTLKQLVDLEPGNVIDLNVSPDQGVDLTIDGRCIGRGELLKIGETLGVRILEKA